ncbi:MAG: Nif3-like dinuclear metal center hexameric protein [Verrucomicrobia bacterium]|nr:Nif3-like dinuclear metal center hexameric protein [Verrucomicrobiota bacterium]MDA1067716.1 Nif3-like dinuclear metal center hexameric protein [Verrucomicrobiota bacterium]
MPRLKEVVIYCDERLSRSSIPDFPGAENGLQFENNGEVRKIGAAVDAGLVPFKKAAEAGIDFLIVHHGMFWNPPYPVTGTLYDKYKLCVESNLAVYGAHLPLDCHKEIGNNAILAKKLKLKVSNWFLEFEGNPIGLITEGSLERSELKNRLDTLFPSGVTAIEKGSKQPEKIAILTGSGASAVSELQKYGVDTLITGELKQNHFNEAEEAGLNLYACGHYATETFGVCALAEEVAEKYGVDWEFIGTDCPL